MDFINDSFDRRRFLDRSGSHDTKLLKQKVRQTLKSLPEAKSMLADRHFDPVASPDIHRRVLSLDDGVKS